MFLAQPKTDDQIFFFFFFRVKETWVKKHFDKCILVRQKNFSTPSFLILNA